MNKKLNKHINIYFKNNYPFKSKINSNYKYTYYLGIGGNIGNVIRTFNLLFIMLKTNSNLSIIKTSPIVKNPPFGFLKQDYFYNSIIIVKTNKAPHHMLYTCWHYENRLKRKRSFKDAPRTLDIDIILAKKYDKHLKTNTKKLIIPHKDYKNRQSVLIPLRYL